MIVCLFAGLRCARLDQGYDDLPFPPLIGRLVGTKEDAAVVDLGELAMPRSSLSDDSGFAMRQPLIDLLRMEEQKKGQSVLVEWLTTCRLTLPGKDGD